MHGSHILLIIGGGVATYKALDLIRRLRDAGASVRCILTAGGAQFITPLSVATLSGQPVFTDLFDLKNESEIGHIQLSREADLILVCPATANRIAKMAAGLADDLAGAVLLATNKPVLLAPAMNPHMWHHPATQRNIAQLATDGVRILTPPTGTMACGETGPGRLPEVPDLVQAVKEILSPEIQSPEILIPQSLVGIRILLTAGPTQEPIDPVRYLGNRSSGKQGFALAQALAQRGAQVTLVAGPVALPTPAGVRRIDVTTAQEMADSCRNRQDYDVALCVAAVADWRVEASPHKLKKSQQKPPTLTLTENPDILATLAAPGPDRPKLVIGFAAETSDDSPTLAAEAHAKRTRKGCDWLLANRVGPGTQTFGGDENAVLFVSAHGTEEWPRAAKHHIATQLADRIAATLEKA